MICFVCLVLLLDITGLFAIGLMSVGCCLLGGCLCIAILTWLCVVVSLLL